MQLKRVKRLRSSLLAHSSGNCQTLSLEDARLASGVTCRCCAHLFHLSHSQVKGRPTSGTTDTCAKAGSECAAGPLQALQLSEAAATGNAPQDSDTAGAAEELGGALVSAESGEAEQPGNLASAGSTASGMLGTGVFLPQAAGQSTTERLSLGAGLPISELMSTLNSLRVAAPSTEEVCKMVHCVLRGLSRVTADIIYSILDDKHPGI